MASRIDEDTHRDLLKRKNEMCQIALNNGLVLHTEASQKENVDHYQPTGSGVRAIENLCLDFPLQKDISFKDKKGTQQFVIRVGVNRTPGDRGQVGYAAVLDNNKNEIGRETCMWITQPRMSVEALEEESERRELETKGMNTVELNEYIKGEYSSFESIASKLDYIPRTTLFDHSIHDFEDWAQSGFGPTAGHDPQLYAQLSRHVIKAAPKEVNKHFYNYVEDYIKEGRQDELSNAIEKWTAMFGEMTMTKDSFAFWSHIKDITGKSILQLLDSDQIDRMVESMEKVETRAGIQVRVYPNLRDLMDYYKQLGLKKNYHVNDLLETLEDPEILREASIRTGFFEGKGEVSRDDLLDLTLKKFDALEKTTRTLYTTIKKERDLATILRRPWVRERYDKYFGGFEYTDYVTPSDIRTIKQPIERNIKNILRENDIAKRGRRPGHGWGGTGSEHDFWELEFINAKHRERGDNDFLEKAALYEGVYLKELNDSVVVTVLDNKGNYWYPEGSEVPIKNIQPDQEERKRRWDEMGIEEQERWAKMLRFSTLGQMRKMSFKEENQLMDQIGGSNEWKHYNGKCFVLGRYSSYYQQECLKNYIRNKQLSYSVWKRLPTNTTAVNSIPMGRF